MSTKPKVALKQPLQRTPRVRLDSVKNPQPRLNSLAARQAATQVRRPTTLQCTNKQCPQSDVDEDDGKLVCKTCGVVVQDAQITSEIQFLDMANGSVAVQGSYVGANEDHARNSALGNSKVAGGMDSRQVALRNGNFAIRQIADGLRLSDTHKARAFSLYTLATGINFIQGREINHVAAVCLYIACRMDTQNRMMLIDFSDALQVNVFKLGHTYSTLVEDLGLREKQGIGEINPEGLIYRFADELELGNDKAKVAEEAVQILKRMERDWMTHGRRPAGVCGAAIILAARMNNYRRTVRELVYIAKVADVTIMQRLDEFKYTDSSKLTVTEFLNHGDQLERSCDPPAYYRQFLNKKRRRVKKNLGTAEDEISDQDSQRTVSRSPSTVQPQRPERPSRQREQLDSQAMPPPPIPIDPALLEVSAQRLSELESSEATTGGNATQATSEVEQVGKKRKRGRPPGTKNKLPPTPTATQLIEENEMESEINSLLEDARTVSQATTLHEELNAIVSRSPPPTQEEQVLTSNTTLETQEGEVPNDTADDLEEEVLETTEPSSPPDTQLVDERPERAKTTQALLAKIPDTAIIPEDEFTDDPEIEDCLLTQAEIDVKERIWVHENAEYLRAKQAKLVKKQLAEANGTARVIVKRKRRRGRMGDMNAYQRITKDGQSIGPQTPEEAVAAMLAKRAYSKKINYQAVHHLLGSETTSESGTLTRRESTTVTPTRGHPSGASTPRVTVTSPTPPDPAPPITIPDDVEDEEDEDDDEAEGTNGLGLDHRKDTAPLDTEAISVSGDPPDDLAAILQEAAEEMVSGEEKYPWEKDGSDEDEDD